MMPHDTWLTPLEAFAVMQMLAATLACVAVQVDWALEVIERRRR